MFIFYLSCTRGGKNIHVPSKVIGFSIGHQLPDKAIDLLDEACANVNKRMMQNQEEKVNEAIVAPNDIAQVGVLFLMTFMYCLNQ